ncbi:MAG TPA: hypothetical protein VGP82_12375 [Ktedonobacterales bacterium]|nr:hypothetical protein [Ktedonobacterales bacterium]
MATSGSGMSAGQRVVFLLDCDNTLLDNDGVKDGMDARLHAILGPELTQRFWMLYEQVRNDRDTVDLPLTFERFEPYCPDPAVMAQVRSAILAYPFTSGLLPETLETLRYLHQIGTPVIVSDGDTVYQPLKIEQSGLEAAVNGQVVIYIHKEDHIAEIMARWPAPFYIAVDDKGRILATLKQMHPDRFVTVHVLQGHYAHADEPLIPPPDITMRSIGELRRYSVEDFRRYLHPKDS